MSGDLISRQTVLKIIDGWYDNNRDAENIEDLIVLITYMDPVNPQEPKTGHWINHQEGRWIYAKCSECETVHDTQTNYCPNCGAKMEGCEEA